MPKTRYAEIDSPQAIANAFIDLTRNVHEVTLRFEGAMTHYPVSVLFVDRILGRCLLDITGIGDLDRTEAIRAARAPSLRCAAHEYDAHLRGGGALNRVGSRCALPDQVAVLKGRSYFRVALNKGRWWKPRFSATAAMNGGRACGAYPSAAAG